MSRKSTSAGYNLKPGASRLPPTFSLREVGEFLGIRNTVLMELVQFGRTYGAKLHPQRGGLYPTFTTGQKRRVPLEAINRHLRHMARVSGENPPPPIVLTGGQLALREGAEAS
ncbi:MAG: hypothetical protein LBK99_10935 [Opitutaceae bacterium]|jgi:hypothetical protein|nr:hypothetical protein [Opitutaceae bacterium]